MPRTEMETCKQHTYTHTHTHTDKHRRTHMQAGWHTEPSLETVCSRQLRVLMALCVHACLSIYMCVCLCVCVCVCVCTPAPQPLLPHKTLGPCRCNLPCTRTRAMPTCVCMCVCVSHISRTSRSKTFRFPAADSRYCTQAANNTHTHTYRHT